MGMAKKFVSRAGVPVQDNSCETRILILFDTSYLFRNQNEGGLLLRRRFQMSSFMVFPSVNVSINRISVLIFSVEKVKHLLLFFIGKASHLSLNINDTNDKFVVGINLVLVSLKKVSNINLYKSELFLVNIKTTEGKLMPPKT